MNKAATPTWLSWMRLARLPGIFTAIADVSVGYLIAHQAGHRLPVWCGLVAATTCFYVAGMILNDYFDRKLDGIERPERPLPSGQIKPTQACAVGIGLLIAGVVVAVLLPSGEGPKSFLRPGWIAVALAAAILLYDGVAKSTLLGPVVMGSCRFLNILMGVSLTPSAETWQQYTPWTIAAGIGLYVMGLTWFARDEATESSRANLFSGMVLMLLGFLMLIMVPTLPGFVSKVRFAGDWVWPMLLCISSCSVWSSGIRALLSPQPSTVQATVKQGLMTIIVLDAALALLLGGPAPAIMMLTMLIPAYGLARFIALT